MATFTYISNKGTLFNLSENDFFWLTNIDKQSSVTASVSSSTIGGLDGDTVHNIQAQPREIVLDMRVKSGVSVELAKRSILRVVKLKQRGYLKWEQESRTVTIAGFVEGIELSRWTKSAILQIHFHCDNPFWADNALTVEEISEAVSTQYFPEEGIYFPAEGIAFGEYDTSRSKQFSNDGDVEVGMDIEITATGTVTNPIIIDSDGNFFGVGYGTGAKQVVLTNGQTVKISTHRGKKSVTLNGASLLDKVKPNSRWLQICTGTNLFAIDSDDDSLTNMTFTISFNQRYI